jgi:hypothetical protein
MQQSFSQTTVEVSERDKQRMEERERNAENVRTAAETFLSGF